MRLIIQISRGFVKLLILTMSCQFGFSSLPASAASEPKHCLSKIKIKHRHTYFSDEWLATAKEQAALKWQSKVKKRFGSVYSNWALARNQKSHCSRIGFGNDLQGRIGVFVLCNYAAEPCVNLLETKLKKNKLDAPNRHQ